MHSSKQSRRISLPACQELLDAAFALDADGIRQALTNGAFINYIGTPSGFLPYQQDVAEWGHHDYTEMSALHVIFDMATSDRYAGDYREVAARRLACLKALQESLDLDYAQLSTTIDNTPGKETITHETPLFTLLDLLCETHYNYHTAEDFECLRQMLSHLKKNVNTGFMFYEKHAREETFVSESPLTKVLSKQPPHGLLIEEMIAHPYSDVRAPENMRRIRELYEDDIFGNAVTRIVERGGQRRLQAQQALGIELRYKMPDEIKATTAVSAAIK